MPTNPDHSATTIEILELFRARGTSQYGKEAVSPQEHALQAAFFAERAGANAALITASLLHDVGHLLHDLSADAPERGIDDMHETLAARWLEKRFGSEIVEPVRMHVDAKRYLCFAEQDYLKQLSPPSVLSLQLQGGVMSEEQATAFREIPLFESAIALRRWDDLAKIPNLVTPTLEHFARYIDEVVMAR